MLYIFIGCAYLCAFSLIVIKCSGLKNNNAGSVLVLVMATIANERILSGLFDGNFDNSIAKLLLLLLFMIQIPLFIKHVIFNKMNNFLLMNMCDVPKKSIMFLLITYSISSFVSIIIFYLFSSRKY
jgi:hypothetical protein